VSRSGYTEVEDNWEMIKYRGQVASAIRGKRGQKFFRELIKALDAMPIKELIAEDLERDSKVCALGALGHAKGIDLSGVDPYDRDTVADLFDIAPQLASETMYENDETYWIYYGQADDPAKRWQHMRDWAESHLIEKV
jgi:hypothetical protein